MCGIFGYYNYQVDRNRATILDYLINGLRRLEYRGYDSAGICIDGVAADIEATCLGNGLHFPAEEANGHYSAVATELLNGLASASPLVIRSPGKIDALLEHVSATLKEQGVNLEEVLSCHTGIAHTRWATHGMPCEVNSHPQSSGPEHEFVVVHNGIVNNFAALKEFLQHHGAKFRSDTDTEVIVKLCKYIYDNSAIKPTFPALVMEVLGQLEGASALLFKSVHYSGQLVACRRGSPLIVGIKDQKESSLQGSTRSKALHEPGQPFEAFVASDGAAVVEHTKQYFVINDNEVYHFADGSYKVYDYTLDDPAAAVPAVLQTLEMEVAHIMKGGFDHFMQKEIHEQPESVLQTMRGRVKFDSSTEKEARPKGRIILGGLSQFKYTICHGRRLMFIACGTSYNACLAARQTVEELVDIPVTLELASDLMDRQAPIFRDDMCVFVSQSGETADTLQALAYAEKRGALCIGVTNTVGSAVSRGTKCGVHINAGCEIGVASTKAYTSQIVVLTMMALALSDDSISKAARREEIIESLRRLPSAIREVLKLDHDLKQLAESLKEESSLLVFGRGYNYATALEAALKVKEVALIHSEGILAGEMKHGPLALVDETLPIIVVATQDRMYGKMQSVILQLLARSARLIILCNQGDEQIAKICKSHSGCRIIEVPKVVDCLQPIVNIVPLQMLSYHLTILRGFNVDQPRNLAKSVTVTED